LPEAKIITTVGTRERKILRKYVKKDRGLADVLTRKPEQPAPASTTVAAAAAEKSPPATSRAVARRQKADAQSMLPKASLTRLTNGIRGKKSSSVSPSAATPETPQSPRTPSLLSRLENPYSKQFNTPNRRKRQSSTTDECSSSDAGGQSPAVLPVTPVATPVAKKARKESTSGAMAGRSPAERYNLLKTRGLGTAQCTVFRSSILLECGSESSF
jgi:hypothetical protein